MNSKTTLYEAPHWPNQQDGYGVLNTTVIFEDSVYHIHFDRMDSFLEDIKEGFE